MRGNVVLDDKPGTYQRNLAELPPPLAPLVERAQWVVWRWDGAGKSCISWRPSRSARPA